MTSAPAPTGYEPRRRMRPFSLFSSVELLFTQVTDNNVIMLSSSSIILPLRRGARTRHSTRDAEPVAWKHREEEEVIDLSLKYSSNQNTAQLKAEVCRVCSQNEARYTCPKCSIPYCSVQCYRNHNGTEGDSDKSSCTEIFYRDRVSQVLRLEGKDREQETKRMLNRAHHELSKDILDDSSDHDELFSKEELSNFLRIIEGGNEEELEKLFVSPRLKTAVHNSVERGELQEWLLEPWHPWWRPELAKPMDKDNIEVDEDEEGEDEEEMESQNPDRKSLDERILAVPSFQSVCPKGTAKPPVELRFNLVDIIYSISLTLRLYHGVVNAVEEPVHAASALIGASAVLSGDARFSSLEEVLAACTEASTRASRQEGRGCNAPWTILVRDVALICSNRRLVARALLEAKDIMRRYVVVVKKDGDSASASRMRRIRKKIEFYLSWLLEQPTVLSTLADDVERWLAKWKNGDDVDDPLLSQTCNSIAGDELRLKTSLS